MIKKARDIQLGDRIGNRIVRLILKDEQQTEWKQRMILHFLDGSPSLELVADADTDVWVDDPAPCCKPESVATYTRAEELKHGMVLCLTILDVENFGSVVKVWVHGLGGSAPLYYLGNDHLRYIKEAPIEP